MKSKLVFALSLIFLAACSQQKLSGHMSAFENLSAKSSDKSMFVIPSGEYDVMASLDSLQQNLTVSFDRSLHLKDILIKIPKNVDLQAETLAQRLSAGDVDQPWSVDLRKTTTVVVSEPKWGVESCLRSYGWYDGIYSCPGIYYYRPHDPRHPLNPGIRYSYSGCDYYYNGIRDVQYQERTETDLFLGNIFELNSDRQIAQLQAQSRSRQGRIYLHTGICH